jgi:hypothetical protein
MIHLTRKEFLNQLLDDGDLAAVAEMWRGWYTLYRITCPAGEGPRVSSMKFGVEVTGFPRQEAESIRDALTRASGDGAGRLQLTDDGDMLSGEGPWNDVAQPSDASYWKRAIASPELERRFVLLRMTINGWRRDVGGAVKSINAIVLAGTPVGGKLLLKSTWAEHGEGFDDVHQHAGWDDERRFLNALEAYRSVEFRSSAVEADGLRRVACTSPREAAEAAHPGVPRAHTLNGWPEVCL